ncbi:restriction endonuclease subunit S [Proteus terrae]|uniref:restriction endonuclease subunit S n=1 Tax=Proteus terrae TaxID=1574161 RepID=UPI0018E70D1D|nr:restriction endonuclease subunit S [Proteus terrae]MBJ2110607.1 restriction endonuclease subunit S [Proteus terrae]MBJ2133196.1 restriction endonuclease subunit S [Proteus terrae]
MQLKTKPLGKLIIMTDERNRSGQVSRLLGINISKNFMPSVANVSGTDLTKYKIIKKDHFACNIMHVGRDERLPIALYTDTNASIVSPAYKTFKVRNKEELLPEYLMIFFQRGEFDRFTWYLCDSSIRGGLEWERFCEIKIPIPSIEEQKRYVSLYKGLIANQQCYESSLNDLKFICDTFLENQIKKGKKVRLGKYISQTEERNTNSSNRNLLGISVNKVFIPSRANRYDLNVSNCKLIKDGQFGYVTVTSRNGEKISIALHKGDDGIISSTYVAFEIIDKSVLLPEYLYLWFSRPEFDRYARYHSWGSARETFDWSDMCDVKLPIPSIEEQKSIVAIHHVLETRKSINERLKEMIRPLCPVLMQGVIKDLKFQEDQII